MSRILLVDDDSTLLDYMKAALRDEGHDVLTCVGGEMALEVSRRSRPELIVLDAMMPRVDGYQLLWHLQQDAVTKHIPTMMLTSRSRAQDRQLGMSLGAKDYVFKPFSLEEVIGRIDKMLDGRQQRAPAGAQANRT